MKYLTPLDIVSLPEYPFTLSFIRKALLRRDKNGLDKACRKIGGRLFIHKEEFDEWVESHKEASK